MSRMFSGAARVAGVVGRPIQHSLSPLLHNAWIAAAGLDAVYVPFGPSDVAGFEALAAVGRAGAMVGLNVTAPFKEDAIRLADHVTPRARACGSANLLMFRDGAVHADSTDGVGLMAALREQAPTLIVDAAPVVVLGAGGAARAAVAALVEAGCSDVRIANRTRDRALALADLFGHAVSVETERGALAEVGLVINALSVPPEIDLTHLPPGAVVMDMTYRPLETTLLAGSRARGLTGVDGLAMLIGQARPSFEALFGTVVPDMDARGLATGFLGEAGR